jgi:hypothetical protein
VDTDRSAEKVFPPPGDHHCAGGNQPRREHSTGERGLMLAHTRRCPWSRQQTKANTFGLGFSLYISCTHASNLRYWRLRHGATLRNQSENAAAQTQQSAPFGILATGGRSVCVVRFRCTERQGAEGVSHFDLIFALDALLGN